MGLTALSACTAEKVSQDSAAPSVHCAWTADVLSLCNLCATAQLLFAAQQQLPSLVSPSLFGVLSVAGRMARFAGLAVLAAAVILLAADASAFTLTVKANGGCTGFQFVIKKVTDLRCCARNDLTADCVPPLNTFL